MKSALIMLTTLMVFSLALIQVVIFPRFQSLITSGAEEWELKYLASGQIKLLADQLKPLPHAQRYDALMNLSHQIGFSTEIRKVDESDFNKKQLEELLADKTVVDINSWSAFQYIGQDEYVVFKNLEEVPEHLINKAQRYMMGSLFLIQLELNAIPVNDWNDYFENVQQRFIHPLSLVDIVDLEELSDTEQRQLQEGLMVTIKTEQSDAIDYPADVVIQRIQGTQRAIKIGPLARPVLEKLYVLAATYYSLFGLMILVPILLWLLPAWLSMNELKKATSAFGRGQLTTRARHVPLSQLNHLSQTYNVMAERIQKLISSHKTLTNTVSHELRTPIARIEFNIELLKNHMVSDYATNQLNQIERSVDELNKLVSEMLTYAHFDREAPDLNLQFYDLKNWLEELLNSWRVSHPDIQFQVNVPLSMSSKFDAFYMGRAISNLIKNATCYGDGIVVISVSDNKNYHHISVEDNGEGVSYAERRDIFIPFYRGSDNRKKYRGGTGLGLSIVKLIVDWHGGKVNVKQSRCGGAHFQVSLPKLRKKGE